MKKKQTALMFTVLSSLFCMTSAIASSQCTAELDNTKVLEAIKTATKETWDSITPILKDDAAVFYIFNWRSHTNNPPPKEQICTLITGSDEKLATTKATCAKNAYRTMIKMGSAPHFSHEYTIYNSANQVIGTISLMGYLTTQ